MTIRTHTLGFPRVGLRRELKAQESYWAGNASVKNSWRWGGSCAPVTGISKTGGY